MSKRKISLLDNEENDEMEEDKNISFFDEELYEDRRIARTQKVRNNLKKEIEDLSNDQILEENQFTKNVDDIDFESLDKSEINKILEDIFKE
jgi:phage terminase Nu1 subunit (DNA packaging protein)